jgi:hypothetical protein
MKPDSRHAIEVTGPFSLANHGLRYTSKPGKELLYNAVKRLVGKYLLNFASH